MTRLRRSVVFSSTEHKELKEWCHIQKIYIIYFRECSSMSVLPPANDV